MSNEEKILQLINSNGPVLPIRVAKTIGTDTIIASAHLSELASRKKVKISRIKVGSSPLYYLPGQEARLEAFSDNLNQKEQEAFSLLKQKKVLKDNTTPPAHRVALRELKDFAFPLEVRYNNQKELFWKWHATTQEETSNLIREIITPKPGEVPKPELEVKEPQKEIEKTTQPQKQQPKDIQKKISVEKPKPKEIKPKKPELKEVTSKFIDSLENYFSNNNVNIIEKNIIRKDSEIELIIKVPSNVGALTYFCKAKGKKRITDGDLSSAFIQGQTKKLPVLFLTKGVLTKKAQEMLENEFKGMTLAQL